MLHGFNLPVLVLVAGAVAAGCQCGSGRVDTDLDSGGGVDAGDPGRDGGNAYALDAGSGDSGPCPPPGTRTSCASPKPDDLGCGLTEQCGSGNNGNSLDDDCDGVVDETCACTPGEVHACFRGPPGKRHVGACTDGTQTCQGGGELGSWGPCRGSISPAMETCDKLDNDCNGCDDDGQCCNAPIDCPAQGDPRIASRAPFTEVALQGGLFFKDAAQSWSWSVEGGPCDQLFATTTGNPPQQSFALASPDSQDASVRFTLSGDYTVTLSVVAMDGATWTCRWVQHVTGPGVRVELCWDRTGDSSSGGGDLDLHVHRPSSTTRWFSTGTGPQAVATIDDCNFANCAADAWSGTLSDPPAEWGYPRSNIAACLGTPAGSEWQRNLSACANPRLDIDNVVDLGKPENTNVDNPRDKDTYRVLVHYYGQDGAASTTPVEQHPIVNIYCGGTLLATYGQAPNRLGPCPGPACFDRGSGWNAGLMWRVADVTAQVDGAGNTVGCSIRALHPPATTSGYLVTRDDTTY